MVSPNKKRTDAAVKLLKKTPTRPIIRKPNDPPKEKSPKFASNIAYEACKGYDGTTRVLFPPLTSSPTPDISSIHAESSLQIGQMQVPLSVTASTVSPSASAISGAGKEDLTSP